MRTHLCFVLAILSSTLTASPHGVSREGYNNEHALTAALQKLAANHPDACRLSSIGSSRQGRALWALELGRGQDRDQRTAMAIVAGLEGDYPATSEVALRIAQKLLAADNDDPGYKLLAEHTVYVLPRINPDAVESFFATPQSEQRRALRPCDDDRDGQIDEDADDDLNGDGFITMMRVKLAHRRLADLQATHLPDPKEPRLLIKADRAKGEHPLYALLVEGIDNDRDELWNEDGPGGVDLNRNFPHAYKDHEPGTGPYQVSEPESKALIDFFLQHTRIAIAIYYGRHDNIVKPPKGDAKKRDANKGGPHKDTPTPDHSQDPSRPRVSTLTMSISTSKSARTTAKSPRSKKCPTNQPTAQPSHGPTPNTAYPPSPILKSLVRIGRGHARPPFSRFWLGHVRRGHVDHIRGHWLLNRRY